MEIKQFIKSIEGLSANTQRVYEQSLWQLQSAAKESEPTEDEIASFLKKYTASSLHRHKAAIKAYLEFKGKPWPFPSRLFRRTRQRLPRYINPDVVKQIADSAENEDDRMFVWSLFTLGCRISELLQIKPEDITPSGVRIIIKGGHQKLKVITATFFKELSAYASNKKGRVFPRPYAYYRKRLKDLASAVGHPEVTPHMLRHCLSPDTMIVCPEGINSAFSLIMQNTPIIAVDIPSGKLINGQISSKQIHDASLLEIWAGGRRIMCSPEHRLFRCTPHGQIIAIQAQAIRHGMYLAGARNLPLVSKETYHPDLWRLVGYFLGDGYMRPREIELYDKNTVILEHYKALLQKRAVECKIVPTKGSKSFRLRLSSTSMDLIFRQLGLETTGELRRIPPQAFQSRTEDIAAIIAGFFDAEGTVGNRLHKFFSHNIRLLQDIQMLLLILGINSWLHRRWRLAKLPKGSFHHGSICELDIISQDDIARFKQLIPTLKSIDAPTGSSIEIVPIGHYLKHILQRYRKRVTPIWSQFPPGLARYKTENHQPSRRNLIKWQKFLQSPIIERVLNYHWLKVSKINRVNYTTPTIDIGVEPTEAFIADGFISHNSRAVDLRRKGLDISSLQQFLDHASISSTAIYLEITRGELTKELEKVEGEAYA